MSHEDAGLSEEIDPAGHARAEKGRVEVALVVGDDDERAHRRHVLDAVDLPVGEKAQHEALQGDTYTI